MSSIITTGIGTASWSWHPHQPAPVTKKTKPQNMFYQFHEAIRENVWSISTPLTTKLYGCKQELEKTASFISRVALLVLPANAMKKSSRRHGRDGKVVEGQRSPVETAHVEGELGTLRGVCIPENW